LQILAMRRLMGILLLLVCSMCIDPLPMAHTSFDRVLVVDAMVTNEAGPYLATVRWSYPRDSAEVRDVEDATVWVSDDLGNRFEFIHKAQGSYYSDESFQGEIGRTYTLHIAMRDGDL